MMDLPLALPTSIYGWISIATAIIVGVLVIRRNDIGALRSANIDLRAEIEDKQRLIEGLQKQLTELKAQLDKLTGIMQEKDKRIDSLEKVQIIQQVSPEVTAYMQDMKTFVSHVQTFMVDTTKNLGEIKGGGRNGS